ncbi:MAG: hypothetical protein P4M00_13715 [Azospirillaceae bacterium]|nr:hypothetical protein [Azospirillaceae bacterium]
MKQEDEDGIIVPPAANSNGSPNGGSPIGGLDPRLRIIARAIGHQIAREQWAAWEGKNRRLAANDNRPEEEGRPDG